MMNIMLPFMLNFDIFMGT